MNGSDPIFFDDWEVGECIEIGCTRITRREAVEFARRWEPQPYHLDDAAARDSIYGGLTLCSLMLFAVCTRLFFDFERPVAVLGMLGKDELRLPHPARPDEDLSYTTECIAKRPSKSRPDRGILTLRDTLANAAGETVLTQKVTLMVSRRPSAGT